MIVKFSAHLTLDIKEVLPETESQWKTLNRMLGGIIEQALESSDLVIIDAAEAILEEKL